MVVVAVGVIAVGVVVLGPVVLGLVVFLWGGVGFLRSFGVSVLIGMELELASQAFDDMQSCL